MICFLGDDFSVIGGVETTTYNLQKELMRKHGMRTDIFSLHDSTSSDKEFNLLSFNYKIKYFSIIAALFYLRRLGYKKIVTSYFAFNVLNVLMSLFLGYTSIIQEHASSQSYSKMKMCFITLFYRFADEFIVLNSYDKEYYKQKRLNPVVLMNCYNYKNENHDVALRKYHLVLSRIDDNKRIHLAVESWFLYRQKGGRYPLIIVGDGPCLTSLREKYSNPDIEFVGGVRHVNKYLSEARSLVITSRFECYPTVVIEGKCVGTPSIAFDVPSGLKDMIVHNRDGMLIPDDRCDLMAVAMLQLDSDERLSQMSKNAFVSAGRYDADNSSEAYFKLFNKK